MNMNMFGTKHIYTIEHSMQVSSFLPQELKGSRTSIFLGAKGWFRIFFPGTSEGLLPSGSHSRSLSQAPKAHGAISCTREAEGLRAI